MIAAHPTQAGQRLTLAILCLGLGLAGPCSTQAAEPGRNTISGTVTIVDKNGREIEDRSNVVVFVDGIGTIPALEDNLVMSHKGRKFSPRVFPIVQGTTVDFSNDDSIYHNVFSLSKARKFDLGIYPEGESKFITFAKPGLVKVYCNIHPKMVSNILVLTNPLYDKTEKDGQFVIDSVPDGEITLRTWSEYEEGLEFKLEVNGGGNYERSLELNRTHRVMQHNNKFGKPYRQKY